MIDLRLGDWRDVLADVECDAIVGDPPYGARTHDDGSLAKQVVDATGQATRQRLDYAAWTPADVRELITSWHDRTRGWMALFTSHDLIPAFEDAYRHVGRYSFAPVPWIDKRPRLLGDGPSSWCCYLMVARPRTSEFSRWRCLPGAYLPGPQDEGRGLVVGYKPVWLMRAVVRDYSDPGDVVVDPFVGGGSTLLAARDEGRRAIGAEIDPDHHAKAAARIARGHTPDLFARA